MPPPPPKPPPAIKHQATKPQPPSSHPHPLHRTTRALDDYVVFDPLLEEKKGKWSKAEQKQKKKDTAWAGRGVG